MALKESLLQLRKHRRALHKWLAHDRYAAYAALMPAEWEANVCALEDELEARVAAIEAAVGVDATLDETRGGDGEPAPEASSRRSGAAICSFFVACRVCHYATSIRQALESAVRRTGEAMKDREGVDAEMRTMRMLTQIICDLMDMLESTKERWSAACSGGVLAAARAHAHDRVGTFLLHGRSGADKR